MSAHIENIQSGRRDFLKTGLGLSLAVCFAPGRVLAAPQGSHDEALVANAFVTVGRNGVVTVMMKHLEMGQGTHTGMATLVAEEMDADWARVRVQSAPADVAKYKNLKMGIQATGGSNAMAEAFLQMRQAGAAARAMLLAAAARQWNVPLASLTVHKSQVIHKASGRNSDFGELASLAAREVVPEQVSLKTPAQFNLIGKPLSRKDGLDKSRGRALYTQDVRLPEMLTAVVVHPPRFGARLQSFDAARALAVKGVVDVLAIPNGVAVLGHDFWSAKKGRDALTVAWDEGQAFRGSSEEMLSGYRELARTQGMSARRDGDGEQALAGAATRIEAGYDFPYLAHASMEPLDCVVRLTPESCEIWNGTQFQTRDQAVLAKLLALKPEQVKINTLYAGGSFGRRANPHSDYVLEAAHIAQAYAAKHQGRATVKMLWTREDDMRAGYYRPMFHHRLQGGLDAAGRPVAWSQTIVGQSIMKGTVFESFAVRNGIDHSSVEGAANLPYRIPHIQVQLHSPTQAVPVQWWRSVGSTHSAYAVESFLDELAHQGGQDPVALRRELLKGHPRHLGVLELVAQKSGWDKPLPPAKAGERRGRGVAVHESFNSYVAQVAEVTVRDDGSFHVDRVVCAVDCGLAINPDVIRAQMEGGIAFGLSAALHGAVTLQDGQVDQGNFDTYPVLRMPEMPRVEVHIVPSAEAPTGVGEPGTPVIAPAVANALFAATGQRLRRLPFDVKALRRA